MIENELILEKNITQLQSVFTIIPGCETYIMKKRALKSNYMICFYVK